LSGGAVVFCSYQLVSQVPTWVIIVFDAAGLGLFAVAGAAKALDFGIHPFIAVLMGGVTGVGGGPIRDVLLARIPTVLRADVYATAALAGAAVLVLGLSLKMNPKLMTILGAVTASHYEWSACGVIGTCPGCCPERTQTDARIHSAPRSASGENKQIHYS
jgi:uncharacterized membrane protein YeiH